MKVRVASAGTGKTTSLVLRYLGLILSGTPLRRIAGVTFTRAGAGELRQRVGDGVTTLLGAGRYLGVTLPPGGERKLEEAARELSGATLSTIHGFMGQALRLCAPGMGLDPDFAVVGDWEAQAIFEEEAQSMLYLALEPRHPLHAAVAQCGDDALKLLLELFRKRSLAERLKAAEGEENRVLLRLYERVMEAYAARLGGRLLGPAELETRALKLVASPQNLARVASRYHYVLVDEFQDVNPVQGRFFEALASSGLRLEVVGDPKQSIYAFRHADVAVFRRAFERGERQPPLTESRRHAQVLVRFLNHLTTTFAEAALGFSLDEAPPVEGAGEQAEKTGRLELHWVTGAERIDLLRALEAQVLAERLKALGQDYDHSDMAVLARSYGGLSALEPALQAAGVPYVLVQGRGYYERVEVRDLYHALRVGLDASGLSFAAWLRGPFVGLPLSDLDRVLGAQEPLALLERDFPEAFERLSAIRREVRERAPIEALKFLIRTPFIGGRRYVDLLDARARENVDALLFTVATQPPGELELLLDRLQHLSRQADAGDVPQGGAGVKLMTVHRAKGLEWPVVALFDASRKKPPNTAPLLVEPETGLVALKDTPLYDALKEAQEAREEEEGYRLLYVAASRARDVLVITGSVKEGRPEGWAAALHKLNVGIDVNRRERPDFLLRVHPYAPVASKASSVPSDAPPIPPPWIDRRFHHAPYPPVFSPSALKGEEDEPLPLPDPEEGETVPGRGRAVGTLVHYAIAQNWQAHNPEHLRNLEAQEVMFPFNDAERLEMMGEVQTLLRTYHALLGRELPWPRDEDYPELPMALPQGTTVWQGIIDRLYRVGERWFLEDYKTDHDVLPERYHVQLAIYARAVREVLNIDPELRLVYLRYGRVVTLPKEVARLALEGVIRFHRDG